MEVRVAVAAAEVIGGGGGGGIIIRIIPRDHIYNSPRSYV